MKINISDSVFECISINNSTIYFPDYVRNYLSQYISFIKKNNFQNNLINKISTFRDRIFLCLIENYSGQKNISYKYFCEALESINFASTFVFLKENEFYRIRSSKTDINNHHILHKQTEMFHIPFEERYKITTQRYSYPGLPCLYLGKSIDVCILECDSANDVYINIAKISPNNSFSIKVVDLYCFDEYDFNNLTEEQLTQFLLLWPLVRCCSFSYKENHKMHFHPEYIIPQMLLEYLIDRKYSDMLNGKNEIIAGIRYHSVKQPIYFSNTNDKYVNYVFPVQENQKKGLCVKLQEAFCIQKIAFLRDIL